MSEDKVAIGKLETKIDGIEKKVEKLEEGNQLLFKMSVILETQTELNKSQSKQLAKMENTFSNINLNLTNMNNSQLAMKDSIEKIATRVDDIEHDLEEEREKDTVSISEHLKKWASWILFGLPSAVLLGFIMYYLNL